MSNERPQLPQKEKADPPKQEKTAQEKGKRSGEGSRSVLPHLKADQRARAVARVTRRFDLEP
jgi:hypothetical protein